MTDGEEAAETEAGETIVAEGPSVDCDGGALGHPRVFLTFDQSGRIDCPYCGLKFERRPGGADIH